METTIIKEIYFHRYSKKKYELAKTKSDYLNKTDTEDLNEKKWIPFSDMC